MPKSHADQLRAAIGEAGAGKLGEYSYCSFSSDGYGRFIPSDNANPHIGTLGQLETVLEERIEVLCDRSVAKAVCEAIRRAHPYEEVAFDIIPLIDENEL